MIQTDTVNMSKRKAQLSMGPSSYNSYSYWGDVKKQWEGSFSSNKITELIGSLSMPKHNLPDVLRYLGKKTAQEEEFSKKFGVFYGKLLGLLTCLDVPVETEYDLAETLLDMRVLKSRIKSPLRVLDIGPGAGRHLVNMFINPDAGASVYVGVESIGLPYSIQNMVAATLCHENNGLRHYEYLDYEFARKDYPAIKDMPSGSIAHIPLWAESLLPDGYFDLIICNYVLDELSAEDFHKIAAIVGRSLADGGIVYCRGGQERAKLRDLYYYGYGTYHGQDITATILSKGLKALECGNIASQMTRFFVKENDRRIPGDDDRYIGFKEDVPLVERMQKDFVAANINEIAASGKKAFIWGDPGYETYSRFIAPYRDKLNIVGMSHRFAQSKTLTGFGITEYPTNDFQSVSPSPDVVIIAAMQDLSSLRFIREMSAPGEFELMRKFNYPIAFAFRKP